MRFRNLLAAATALVLVAGCAQSAEPTQVPDHLIGRWETSEARYADRFVEIRPGDIAFGTGTGIPSRHAIVGLQEEQEPRGRRYTIEYLEEGETRSRFAIYFDESGPYVRLASQPGFEWVQREAS